MRVGRREPLGADFARALELACEALAARPRSAAEIRRRLSRAGAEEETIARVLARLVELRYLDDAAFSLARAGSLARRGFGPRAMAAKLAQAGVGADLARAGIARVVEDEAALAAEALSKRLRGRPWASLDPKERARLVRWLAGRGFSPGAIRAARGGRDDDV